MWNRLVEAIWRPKAPKPNLDRAIDDLNKQVEDLENTAFYLNQVEDHKLTEEEKMYYTRANFNLRSFRDELMISNRTKKEKRNGKSK